MIQNFKGKKIKDIETAEESLIYNSGLVVPIKDSIKAFPRLTITYQQQNNEDIDEFMEKKR